MMKRKFCSRILPFLAAWLFAFSANAQEADSTGLPGDNFSLEGALELFKKAESPEDFEKLLNAEDNSVNNLDLNDDNEIDYIRVVDNMDAEVHAVILQVPVSETESQDIAVIEIEKTGDEEATLQILGDEDVFGEQKIVEPYEVEANENGKNGPHVTVERIVVNVWGWPTVRFVYRPGYRVWVSPWRWRYYPVWWRPFRPHPWHVFHPRVVVFHPHYHVVTTHRVVHAHRVYAPHRTTSKTVHTRTTVVKGRNGGVGVKKTTTTTTKHKNGNVTQKKTTTKAGKGKNGNVGATRKTTTKKRRG
ncbi:MAG: hypothetical protein HY842_01295 [Bacteroidetes bacterium]|nr:hypothetical protein [Bacteroidota bacterium]